MVDIFFCIAVINQGIVAQLDFYRVTQAIVVIITVTSITATVSIGICLRLIGN